MDGVDLQVKYQKLATEYSKLRAQNQVLKKAVIEEQSRTSQLKDVIKSKDQAFRKVDQEIESLSFRNQQLARRLVLLQNDLDQSQVNSNASGNVKQEYLANSIISNQNVYVEELKSKIEDNARLHAEISDIEIFYKNKVVELDNKLDDALKNQSRNEDFNKSQEIMLQKELKKNESQRIEQDVYVQKMEADVISLQNELHDLKNQINSDPNTPFINLDLNTTSDSNDTVILDSPIKYFDKLCKRKLIAALTDPINQLSNGFIGLLNSYFILLKNSSSLTVIQSRHMNQLTGENHVWQSLSKHYEEIMINEQEAGDYISLSSITGLDAFSKSVENCSTSLRKILPILCEKLYFKEGQIESPWRNSMGSLVGCWAAITPYLSALAAHSDERTILSTGAIKKILSLLRNRLSKFYSTSQELLTAWELLSTQGNNEAKVTIHLQTITDSLNKILSLFSENINVSTSQGSSCASTPSSTFSIGAIHVSNSSFPSIPYAEAASWSSSMHDGLHLADSEASLAQQLAQATSRLTKLEEEREHWRLEYQLLNHKFEKEIKKYQVMENEMKTIDKSHKICDPQNTNDENVTVSTSSIGQASLCFDSSEEREKEIRTHFTTRCSHLYLQLTSSMSQAALYQNECEGLIRRLAASQESKALIEYDLEGERKEISSIQETLATTSRNYEEQISTMSEHLADLNEKITGQADMIEQLKFESKKKGRRV